MNIEIEDPLVDVIPPVYLVARGGAVISGGGPIYKGGADVSITLTSSADGNHSVMLWGYEE